MRFTLQREALLKPLSQVVNVVERRQTKAILGNLLIHTQGSILSMTTIGSDMEMVAKCQIDGLEEGAVTIPARKLYDLIRSLPDAVSVTISVLDHRALIEAGRCRFQLPTLPATDFPRTENLSATHQVLLAESQIKRLIEQTAFAMANEDIRYCLNGLLFDLDRATLRCVATDGHRLALSESTLEYPVDTPEQLIVPRKGILELQRLLEADNRPLTLEFGTNHVRVEREDVVLTSKLIDARFPDYATVVPIGADQIITVERDALRTALQRAAIVTHEKYRGVRLSISPGQLQIQANNHDQEEVLEDIAAETDIENLVIGLNVYYLLDALNSLRDERVMMHVRDPNSSVLLCESEPMLTQHVIMPLRI